MYVETNFLVEIARSQEEHASADEILRLCEESRAQLVYPGFAIFEPFTALRGHAQRRKEFNELLQKQIGELTRTLPNQELVAAMKPVHAAVPQIAHDERKRLDSAVSRVLKCGQEIPLSSSLFQSALLLTQEDFEIIDAIMLASVLHHASQRMNETKVFLNRNTADFAAVAKAKLAPFQCSLIGGFDDGLAYIEANA